MFNKGLLIAIVVACVSQIGGLAASETAGAASETAGTSSAEPAAELNSTSPARSAAEVNSSQPAASAAEATGTSQTEPVTKPDQKPSKSESSKSASKRSSSSQSSAKKTGSKNSATARRGNAPCMAWIDPATKSHAVILCVHGLGLHNGTYEDFGKRMAKLGFPTYAIDVRGFGSWMEAKGRERVDFEGALLDIQSTLKVIRRANRGVPVFILGESMGGAIALRATALYPDLVDGLISSVPAGDRFKQAKTNLKVALRLIGDPDKPFNVGEGVIKQATNKEELRASWANDPLARMNISARELMQFQNFMNQNHESAKLIKDKPVLFVQGCNDKLVRPEGTVELFNELATTDRQIVLIPNAEHLIFEENQFTDQNIEAVNKWLLDHLPSENIVKEESPKAAK